jgi:hypothetical protein
MPDAPAVSRLRRLWIRADLVERVRLRRALRRRAAEVRA